MDLRCAVPITRMILVYEVFNVIAVAQDIMDLVTEASTSYPVNDGKHGLVMGKREFIEFFKFLYLQGQDLVVAHILLVVGQFFDMQVNHSTGGR